MSDWIKRFHRDHGIEFKVMPSIDVMNQILKYSEADKEQAIKHMTNLFKESAVSDIFSPDMCKGLVEDYLKNPYLTDADLEK